MYEPLSTYGKIDSKNPKDLVFTIKYNINNLEYTNRCIFIATELINNSKLKIDHILLKNINGINIDVYYGNDEQEIIEQYQSIKHACDKVYEFLFRKSEIYKEEKINKFIDGEHLVLDNNDRSISTRDCINQCYEIMNSSKEIINQLTIKNVNGIDINIYRGNEQDDVIARYINLEIVVAKIKNECYEKSFIYERDCEKEQC